MIKLDRFVPYLYLLPALVFLLLVYIPIFQNIGDSMYNWSTFSPDKAFVGMDNYFTLFKDPVFYAALKNNILYAVISIIFQVFGGLIVAAVLEDKLIRKFSPIFRTVYFLPVVVSMTVIALLFSFFYNPEVGLLNQFLKMIGLNNLALPWLGDSETAIYAVIAVSQWQSIGYIAMLFIVSIQKISPELYEAAEMDGANKIKTFFHITVPATKEMTFVAVILTLTGAFTVFNEPYILTGGGPGTSSEVLSTYLYKTAFSKDMMGYASAIATVILIITLLISLVQMKIFKTGKGD
ncbi:sugar ABC transporter permease [Vibrio vulnificus]|nr:sugar ABC transporter permease [Vibrio vulnificus]